MTDDEINQACAKALGGLVSNGEWLGPWSYGLHRGPLPPNFCTDHNAAALLRSEVAKRGLVERFLKCVWKELYSFDGIERFVEWGWQSEWDVCDASPRVQARAFLEVVKS